MNPGQMAEQIKYLLENRTWPDSPSEKVFGAVRVTDGPTDKGIKELRQPFCLVTIGDIAEVDPEEPGLILQDFPIIVVQSVLGDPMGERILTGGPRSSQGSSDGRGILELETQVDSAVGKLTGADGARAIVAYVGSPPSERVGESMVGSRKYVIRAWCTKQPYYDAPVHLTATASGGGAVALTWTNPPDRYDRKRIILRRAVGATAPTSPLTGDGVTLASDLATSVTDTPGVGQFSYSLWCSYTETGRRIDERYSMQEVGTTRTVTAT